MRYVNPWFSCARCCGIEPSDRGAAPAARATGCHVDEIRRTVRYRGRSNQSRQTSKCRKRVLWSVFYFFSQDLPWVRGAHTRPFPALRPRMSATWSQAGWTPPTVVPRGRAIPIVIRFVRKRGRGSDCEPLRIDFKAWLSSPAAAAPARGIHRRDSRSGYA